MGRLEYKLKMVTMGRSMGNGMVNIEVRVGRSRANGRKR